MTDFSKIAEDLALTADAVRKLDSITKQADIMSSVGDAFNSVKNSPMVSNAMGYVNKNPMLAKALIGGVGGAALGGASSFLAPRERRNTGRSALHGALAGAGLGVGTDLLQKFIKNPRDAFNISSDSIPGSLFPSMPSSGGGTREQKILDTINSYQSPKFTEGLAGAYLNPYMAGVAGVDAGRHALGMWAASGENGRLSTQGHHLRDALKNINEVGVHGQKALGERLTTELYNPTIGVENVVNTAGRVAPSTVDKPVIRPVDRLRQLLSGQTSHIRVPEVAAGAAKDMAKGPKAKPSASAPGFSVTPESLRPAMDAVPGSKMYPGGIGSLGHVLERLGGRARGPSAPNTAPSPDDASKMLERMGANYGKRSPAATSPGSAGVAGANADDYLAALAEKVRRPNNTGSTSAASADEALASVGANHSRPNSRQPFTGAAVDAQKPNMLERLGKRLQQMSYESTLQTPKSPGTRGQLAHQLKRILTLGENSTPMLSDMPRARTLARAGIYGLAPLGMHAVSKTMEASRNKQDLLKLLKAYTESGGDASNISPEVAQVIEQIQG